MCCTVYLYTGLKDQIMDVARDTMKWREAMTTMKSQIEMLKSQRGNNKDVFSSILSGAKQFAATTTKNSDSSSVASTSSTIHKSTT
jgi:hypothetical protein